MSRHAQSGRWWLGLAGLSLVATLASAAPTSEATRWFEGGTRPLTIGATPEGLAGTNASTCAPCHAAIVAEWRGSLHAAAWTDPVFQASYAQEPLAFCRNCHAPLNEGGTPRGVAAREGVSCAACHVRDGMILGTGRGGLAPHPVRVVAALASSEFCAPCHEFGFHRGEVETAELQQSTMSEWRERVASGATTAACQGCHMPATGADRHRGHAFPGGRDAALVASAVDIDVRLDGDAAHPVLAVTLAPGVVGHAFPTGDLYRRLELHAWMDSAAGGAPEERVTQVYARTFRDRRVGSALERYEVRDTRVGEDDPTTRRLDLAALATSRGALLRWRLDYLLMPALVAHDNGVPASANVRTIAEGTLTLP